MLVRSLVIVAGMIWVTSASWCSAQGWGPNRSSGTAVGGLSGGAIGAALGSQRGKTAEGALIGGVAGAILGNALGNQADIADERRQMAYQREYQQEYVQTVRSAVSYDQVVQMVHAGLSPEVIANQIQNQGIVSRPTTQDIIYLKSQGVPDRVIAAMQSAWTAADRPVATQYRPEPVYRERPVVVVEEYYRPVPAYHYHYRYRPAPPPCPPPYRGNHFGFTIGF